MPDHVPERAALGTPAAAPADLSIPLPRPDGEVDVLTVLRSALGPVRDVEALDTTLRHLAEGAVRLVPEVSEAVFVVDLADGRQCRAATGPVARTVAEAELVTGDGPALAAGEQREVLHLVRRTLDEQWPALGDLAVRHGVRGLVCAPLLDRRRARGALVGVAPEVSLSSGSRRLLETLAAAATGAVERLAHQQDVSRALETRSSIGQAIGIVMERYDLAQDRAWDYLVRQASSREVKLAVVARELVEERERRAADVTAPPPGLP